MRANTKWPSFPETSHPPFLTNEKSSANKSTDASICSLVISCGFSIQSISIRPSACVFSSRTGDFLGLSESIQPKFAISIANSVHFAILNPIETAHNSRLNRFIFGHFLFLPLLLFLLLLLLFLLLLLLLLFLLRFFVSYQRWLIPPDSG